MSAIDSLGSLSNPTSSTDAFSALSSGEFLEIIFTELTNQDPLEPNDTQSMLNQLSTLRSIESDTQMVDSLSQLVTQSEFAAASSLIGSLVSGITLDNRRVADLVVSVSMTQDGPVLNLFDGSRMFFNNVDEIVGPIDDLNNDDGDPPIDNDDDDPDDGDPPIDTDIPTPILGDIDPGDIDTGEVPDGNSVDPVQILMSNDV
ncbi:MAG: flagellar hook capping FlgD N-terminal domain-containing protein [Phycisphaerales bacterium JB052]